MKRLVYLSVAEMDLAEAVNFYDEKQPGVGKLFLDAVQEAGERIRRNPDWWPFLEAPVRGCRIFPFPYRLLYRDCRIAFKSLLCIISAAGPMVGKIA